MIHMNFTQYFEICIYDAMMTEGTNLNLYSEVK